MINNPTYRVYEAPNQVIAVSSFAGKTVRAIAKCNPADTYDFEKGASLACARCGVKIAEKRVKRAYNKVDEAKAQLDAAINHYTEMLKYQSDSEVKLNMAQLELDATLSWICDKSENSTCGDNCECGCHCHD